MVIIQEVFEYLKQKGFYKTLFSLEEESGLLSFEGQDDLKYIYQLVTKGKFSRLSSILEEFKEFDLEIYKEGILQIKTQSVLEKIENFGSIEEIKQNFSELRSVCDLSHLSSIHESLKNLDLHDFKNWEKWSGRFHCWENLQSILNPEVIEEDLSLSSSDHNNYSDSYEKEDTVLYESIQ